MSIQSHVLNILSLAGSLGQRMSKNIASAQSSGPDAIKRTGFVNDVPKKSDTVSSEKPSTSSVSEPKTEVYETKSQEALKREQNRVRKTKQNFVDVINDANANWGYKGGGLSPHLKPNR